MTAAGHELPVAQSANRWEYKTTAELAVLHLLAAAGWRLHTAVPYAGHIQYVLERARRTEDG
jgi:hypothetical protein